MYASIGKRSDIVKIIIDITTELNKLLLMLLSKPVHLAHLPWTIQKLHRNKSKLFITFIVVLRYKYAVSCLQNSFDEHKWTIDSPPIPLRSSTHSFRQIRVQKVITHCNLDWDGILQLLHMHIILNLCKSIELILRVNHCLNQCELCELIFASSVMIHHHQN